MKFAPYFFAHVSAVLILHMYTYDKSIKASIPKKKSALFKLFVFIDKVLITKSLAMKCSLH